MKNKKILIVEDDSIIALEIQSRLEEQGYGVLGPYTYGEDVIENIGNLDVDLILMDINLKGRLDGIQTALIIKNKFRKPIIYLTAYADKKTLERAKITEPFGYIIKPFDERELFTNIEMALYKHKIEMKLLESEQWLNTTLKSIGDGVIATDINFNIKFINKVAENLTGWNSEDTIGKKVEEVFYIINEANRKPAVNHIKRVIREGIFTGLENHTLLISKNGREIPIADKASPIVDSDGKVVGGVLIFQDQTNIRKFQNELKESEEKYRSTLESLDDGIYVVDRNLDVILMNNTLKSWAKELGCTNYEDYRGKNLNDYEPFVNERIINDIKHTFEARQPYISEEDYSSESIKLYTETKRIPIYSIETDPKLVTIIRDISKSKEAEEALKESEMRYRRLHESMTDCFVQVTISGEIINANSSYLNMLGYTYEEIFELKYTDITPQIWWEYEKHIVETQILPFGHSEIYEKEYIRKDGTVFPVELRTYLLRDKFENPIGMWAIVRDITDRKKAESEIQQKNLELANLNATKDKFFSIIAHDLRGPFSGFLGLTKIIAEEFQDISIQDMKEMGLNLKNSANNLYVLLDNLLVWSQVQSGGIRLKPEHCDLSFIVNHNFEIHFDVAKQKQIQLLNRIPENTIVFADMPMLNTILRNLVSNAIKFTPRNGRIELDIQSSDLLNSSEICIFVRDNGIDMSEDMIEKLFKLEYKVSTPGTENEPSSGLGLILCHEFIKKIGGQIWVESELGKGSTFYFTLPKAN